MLNVGKFICLGLFAAVAATASAASYKVDTAKSTLHWEGKKVAGAHNGTVAIKSGAISTDAKGMLSGGQFTIDLTTIKCIDLKDSPKWHDKLVGHLKSVDFFNVDKYPNAMFKITSTKSAGNGKVTIEGDLTIKGIIKPIAFTAKTETEGKKFTMKADFKINRLLWNIRYNSGKFFDVKKLGDKMIDDDIGFKVNVVARS